MNIPRFLNLKEAATLLGGNGWLSELLEAVERRELKATISGNPQEWTDRIETADLRAYLVKYYGADLLASIKADQPAKVDRPLSTRQRRTLLTIIAAFCKFEGLDPKARGTAQRVMEMTDNLGAHVDDGTIAKLLVEIPDALETRMK